MYSPDGSIFRCLREVFVVERMSLFGLRTQMDMVSVAYCCMADSERLQDVIASAHWRRRRGPDSGCTSRVF